VDKIFERLWIRFFHSEPMDQNGLLRAR
jgi:hypothetical protein